MNPAIRGTPDGALIDCHIQPGAKRAGVIGMYGARLKVAVASPPVDGRANAALTAFFAEFFHVPKRSVEVRSGAASRGKTILIRSVSAEEAERVVTDFLSGQP